MSKLYNLNDTTVETRRVGIGALQCLWTLPEATRQTSADKPQDRRDKEQKPGKECWAESKAKGMSLFDGNGLPPPRSEAGTPPPNHLNHRRVSHRTSTGGSDRSNSPISRAPTPGLQHPNIAPQHLFDGVSLAEHNFHHSPSLPALPRQPSPGSTTSLNDRHLEPPATYESLLQSNNTLKTRVNELEVINGLFKGRVNELEDIDRRAQMVQNQLRQALEQSQHREHDLKRRLDDLDREVAELRELDSPHVKRLRTSDISEYPDPPEPMTATI
ncbi:hypothetical protein MMC14_002080 [Varicellaria rhodocarpa]|nr:hypothetical protein [Varicellaria rhodocarpa]